MGRMYTSLFRNVSVSAAQDFFELVAATGKPIAIHSILVTVRDSETNEQFETTLTRAAGTYTSGSGGSTHTPSKLASNEAAAGATCEINNTSRASAGTGSLTILHAEGWPSQGGFSFIPTPECRIVIAPGEALVVGLENAPGAATNMDGVVYFEELA